VRGFVASREALFAQWQIGADERRPQAWPACHEWSYHHEALSHHLLPLISKCSWST
jgi:hypothetical protein